MFYSTVSDLSSSGILGVKIVLEYAAPPDLTAPGGVGLTAEI